MIYVFDHFVMFLEVVLTLVTGGMAFSHHAKNKKIISGAISLITAASFYLTFSPEAKRFIEYFSYSPDTSVKVGPETAAAMREFANSRPEAPFNAKVSDDDSEAVQFYRAAADRGSAKAQYSLGDFYERGRGGVRADDVQALKYYKLAAEQELPEALFSLARFYETGRGGLTKDYSESLKMFKLSAEKQYAFAQLALGHIYDSGLLNLQPDDQEARKYYELAAAAENSEAQVLLGEFYIDGRGGLPVDEVRAVELFKKSAEQGNTSATSWLAEFYMDGRGGLPKNDQAAAKFITIAANQYDEWALYYKAVFLINGRGGFPLDIRKAAMSMYLAATVGSEDARDALPDIVNTLPRLFFDDVLHGRLIFAVDDSFIILWTHGYAITPLISGGCLLAIWLFILAIDKYWYNGNLDYRSSIKNLVFALFIINLLILFFMPIIHHSLTSDI